MGDVETADWLSGEYPTAYRAAWLLLDGRGPVDQVVAGAFGRAWRFRRSLGEGPALRPWLYRLVVSGCAAAVPGPPVTGVSCGPEDRAPVSDFDRAWTELPPALRAPVLLRLLVGLDEREAALALGRRASWVRSRLEEARLRLGWMADARWSADQRPEVRP